MTDQKDTETLARVCAEIEATLRSALSKETMAFVARFVEAKLELQEAERQTESDEIWNQRVREAVMEALSMPPASLFVGKLSARQVVENYLRWSGKPTEVAKIASDAFDRGWKRKPDDKQDDVYKSLNAGIASHAEGKDFSTNREQPKLFRYDKKTGIVALLEWN